MSFRDDGQALRDRLALLEGVERENALLRSRVAELETEVRRLSSMIQQLRGVISPPQPPQPSAATSSAARAAGRIVLGMRVHGPVSTTVNDKEYTFDADIIKIGRMKSCQLMLDHAGVSRMHAVIERSDKGFMVVDLGTTEGTRVNGAKTNKAKLTTGDTLTIGPFTIAIAIGDPSR